MLKHPFYVAFGVLMLLLVAAAEARGWFASSRSEVRNIPPSVRDNPGSYRPTYFTSGSRYRRGK
jgi:hypothetical protein